MGHTKENSATYILVSNFKGSMRLQAFIGYLGLSDIKLSKNAILEDGTHRLFDTPSVKVQGQPDMYILDNKQKNVHTVQKIFCLKQKCVDIAGKKYKLKKLESFCQIYSFFCKDVGKPNTVFKADNADKLRCGLKQC